MMQMQGKTRCYSQRLLRFKPFFYFPIIEGSCLCKENTSGKWYIKCNITRKPCMTILYQCHWKYIGLHNQCGARWEGWVEYRQI